MSQRLRWLRRAATAAGLAVSAVAAAAADFTAAIDEFWIAKGAAGAPLVEIFRDSFADGVLPPTGPDGAETYATFGDAGLSGEAGGRLTLTPALGDAVLITTTFADVSTNAMRQLATNPANPNFLGIASAFEIHGRFDLASLPTVAGQSFGIRASDRAPALGNEGNNGYYLFIGVNPNNGARNVTLRRLDFTANSSTVIDSVSIESLLPGAEQIEFVFAKAAGAGALTASYSLYDLDLANPIVASGAVGAQSLLAIYDGEAFIRAQFEATDRIPPIPEPGTWALMAAGLAALGLARRRARHG